MLDLRNHMFATHFCRAAAKAELADMDMEFLERFEGTDILHQAALFFYQQKNAGRNLNEDELKDKTIILSNGEEVGFEDINRAIILDGDISYLKMLKHLEEVFLKSLDLTHIMQAEVDEQPIVPNDGIRFSSILIYAPYETAVVYFSVKYMAHEQDTILHNNIMKHLDDILTKSGLEGGVMETPLTEEEVEQFIDSFGFIDEEIQEIIEAYQRATRVYGQAQPKGVNLN